MFTGKEVVQFSWLTFLSPFHWIIWLCLLGFIIVFSIALWLFYYFQSNDTTLNIIEGLCIASSSIFGMAIFDLDELNSNHSGRLVMFNFFLSGSVFFYTYNAFLMYSLAVQSENIPFNSPEALLRTNYR